MSADICQSCDEAPATVADLYCDACMDAKAEDYWNSDHGKAYAAQLDAEALSDTEAKQ